MLHVGLLQVRLDFPGVFSLKEKRGRIKGLLSRVRQRFEVAAAEVAHHDLPRSAGLAFAVVGNDAAVLAERLQKVVEHIGASGLGVLVDYRVEMLT